jgi:hypothetical protein
MISNNRADYNSADEWLSAIKLDELWMNQLQQLQNSTPTDASTLRDRALEKIGKGETYGFWDSYNHQVELVVREVWEIAELSLPKLKIQTVGMLSMEWLEQHSEMGRLASEKPKKPSSKQKPKAKTKKKPSGKPMTLKYFTYGNNGVLKKQRRRVRQVFNMWNRWDWIDEQTDINDFDAFFEGAPRHCNITWKASCTILTILLQELLKQTYIEKSTGCAAKSLVEQQFGKTANSDRTRLDNISEERIKLTLLVLDPKNHDLLFQNSDDLSEIQDIQDAALQEIFAGQLRSTKGI